MKITLGEEEIAEAVELYIKSKPSLHEIFAGKNVAISLIVKPISLFSNKNDGAIEVRTV